MNFGFSTQFPPWRESCLRGASLFTVSKGTPSLGPRHTLFCPQVSWFLDAEISIELGLHDTWYTAVCHLPTEYWFLIPTKRIHLCFTLDQSTTTGTATGQDAASVWADPSVCPPGKVWRSALLMALELCKTCPGLLSHLWSLTRPWHASGPVAHPPVILVDGRIT